MHIRTLAAICGCTMALTAGAAEVRYLEPSTGDRVVAGLATAKSIAEPVFNVAQEPVSFSWAVDAETELAPAPTPHVTRSRQYWLDADGAELARGIELHTTAAEALVRITPIDRSKALPLAAASGIHVVSRTGHHTGEAAVSVFADANAMKSTGAGFSDGTVAFRLAPGVGSGDMELRFEQAPAADSRFVVHVFEPGSPVVLALQSRRDSWLAGQPIVLDVTPVGTRSPVGAAAFSGYLASPGNEHVAELSFVQQPDGGILAMAAPEAVIDAGGLWEAHVFMDHGEGHQRVLRDAQTAFAVDVPTIRYTGVKPLAQGIGVDVQVAIAAPGRYEARGVLYGTMADGRMVPVAVAHAARWLEGPGQVSLEFDQAAISSSPAAAPYEVRQFELRDQSRMANVWRQERAFLLQ